jgi:hypothetical protein
VLLGSSRGGDAAAPAAGARGRARSSCASCMCTSSSASASSSSCSSARCTTGGAVRLEPTWTVLGESAGVAAALAARAGVDVQDIDVAVLQARLRAVGQVLEL